MSREGEARLGALYAAFNARQLDRVLGALVRDRAGALLEDEMVQHVYRLEGGLVRSMEIRPAPLRSAGR